MKGKEPEIKPDTYYATYMGIPCKYTISTRELWAGNPFMDLVLFILVWVEVQFIRFFEWLGFDTQGLVIKIYNRVKERENEKD